MITTNLYIPTNSVSLAFYFESGLILSRNHQGQLSGQSIIISKEKWVENSNCSIEVVLNEEEKKNLKPISDSFFEYSLPIPITRIVQIRFLEKERMENTIWNINIGTAFIAKRLVSVDESSTTPKKFDSRIMETTELSDNISVLVNRFNVLLGGFAFMKLAANSGSNFPHNYFSTFSFFHKTVEDDVRDAETKYGLQFDRKYIGLFTTKNQEIWANWTKYIYGTVSPKDVQTLASYSNVVINNKLGNIQLDTIPNDTILFDVALLATYGNNKSKSIEDLLSFLYKSQLPEAKVEEITLLFGLHLGYASLRNSYKYGLEEKKVKFQLENRLDYYIIESIYQFVFKGSKENKSFDYLESIIPIHNVASQGDLYYVLDHPVFFKKKENGGNIYLEDLENEFWNEMALINNNIVIPGFKSDYNSSREFYIQYGGPALKKFVSSLGDHYKRIAVMAIDKKNRFSDKQPKVKFVESSPISTNTFKQSGFSDEYDSMLLSELKSIAKSKGIKNLSNYKATQKDMKTLINLIREVQNIL